MEFFELTVTFSFADLLQDNLLGRLRRDPAHFNGGNFVDDLIADSGTFFMGAGIANGHFDEMVLDLFDNGAHTGEGGFACFTVNRHADIKLGAVARFSGAREALFHRFNHQFGVDHLFAGYGLGCLQKLQLVC